MVGVIKIKQNKKSKLKKVYDMDKVRMNPRIINFLKDRHNYRDVILIGICRDNSKSVNSSLTDAYIVYHLEAIKNQLTKNN